jgi:hypothetical protein
MNILCGNEARNLLVNRESAVPDGIHGATQSEVSNRKLFANPTNHGWFTLSVSIPETWPHSSASLRLSDSQLQREMRTPPSRTSPTHLR